MKFCCSICEWDSRKRESPYSKELWQLQQGRIERPVNPLVNQGGISNEFVGSAGEVYKVVSKISWQI
jgi:hypothetical protein